MRQLYDRLVRISPVVGRNGDETYANRDDGNRGLRRQRETHCPPSASLERPMHGARIAHEVRPGLRVSGEELVRQHVALEAITGRTGNHEVARRVRAAAGYRMNVVKRRFKRFEVMSAVNTTPSAVAHRGALERTFVVARKNWSPTMPVTPS